MPPLSSRVAVVLMLPKDVQNKYALPGGEAASDLHLTLAYYGRVEEIGREPLKRLCEHVRLIASGRLAAPLMGVLNGFGRFSASESSEGRDVFYLSLDAPGLTTLRTKLVETASLPQAKTEHDFIPHVTISFLDVAAPTPESASLPSGPIAFPGLTLMIEDERELCLFGETATLDRLLEYIERRTQEKPMPDVVKETAKDALVSGGPGTLAPDQGLPPGTQDALAPAPGTPSPRIWESKTVRVPAQSEQVDIVADGDLALRYTFFGDTAEIIRAAKMAHLEADAFFRAALDGTEYKGSTLGLVEKVEAAQTEAVLRVAYDEHLQANGFEASMDKDVVAEEVGQIAPGYNLYRVKDGWGEWYFTVAGGTASWVAQKMADVQAFAVSKKLSGLVTRGSVKKLGWGDKAWDEMLLSALQGLIQSRAVKIFKSDGAQRYTLGIAYPASELDTHKDFMSPAELEKTAWNAMRKGINIGTDHAKGTDGSGVAVESYIWRGPSTSIEGQTVDPGDWLLGVVWNDKAWARIVSGELTGFSMQGWALKVQDQ